MPLETEFDPKLAAHLTAWIWVKKRVGRSAVCEVYVANNHRKGGRGLDIEAIIKREEKWTKENPKKTTINPTIHPEYCGRIIFAAFTKEEQKRYDELVKIKSATGKLTDEELEKWGIESSKTSEEIAEEIAKKIANGEITDKVLAWDAMKELDVPDKKKIELVSFYLKLFDLGTFNKVFDNKKKKLSNIAEQLKKKI